MTSSNIPEYLADIYRYILKCGRPVKVVPMINNEYLLIIGWGHTGMPELLGPPQPNYSPSGIDTGYAKFILSPKGTRRL